MKWFNIKIIFNTGRSESWNIEAINEHTAVQRLNEIVVLALYGEITDIEVK